MNAAVKLIIGILITISGLAWYIWGSVFEQYIGMSALKAFGVLFVGSFGAVLILLGLLVTWIEIEDFRDEMAQKNVKAEKPETEEKKPAEKKPAKKRK